VLDKKLSYAENWRVTYAFSFIVSDDDDDDNDDDFVVT